MTTALTHCNTKSSLTYYQKYIRLVLYIFVITQHAAWMHCFINHATQLTVFNFHHKSAAKISLWLTYEPSSNKILWGENGTLNNAEVMRTYPPQHIQASHKYNLQYYITLSPTNRSLTSTGPHQVYNSKSSLQQKCFQICTTDLLICQWN